MKVLKRLIDVPNAKFVMKVVPLGDVHIGSAACNEKLFREVVDSIAADPEKYWISMGDVADYIARTDPRFTVGGLAKWIKTVHLSDLASAQSQRYLDIIKPIAHKCLTALSGNHELMILKHYERDIHTSNVETIKKYGGLTQDIDLGYAGWLLLTFRLPNGQTETIKLSLHHGFGGAGTGSKTINMQKWLWTHGADIAVFGHTHNTGIQIEAVEEITAGGTLRTIKRFGAYAGSFLSTSFNGGTSYSEMRGYPTLPLGGVEIIVKPFSEDRIRIMCG